MNGAVLLTALATGLAGSAHCVAMCGGISASLGLGSTRKRYLLVYHGGRLLSYSTLGLIFGCLLLGSLVIAAALWTVWPFLARLV